MELCVFACNAPWLSYEFLTIERSEPVPTTVKKTGVKTVAFEELCYTRVAPVPAIPWELHVYLCVDFKGMLNHDLKGFEESHEQRPILSEFFSEAWATRYVKALPRTLACTRGREPHRDTGPSKPIQSYFNTTK